MIKKSLTPPSLIILTGIGRWIVNFSAGRFQSVEEGKDLQQSLQPHKDYQLKQVGSRTSAES